MDNEHVATESVEPDESEEEFVDDEATNLDLMLEVARERAREQAAYLSTLDTKAGFVIGSASLLTASMAGFLDAVLTAATRLSAGQPDLALLYKVGVLVVVLIVMGLYLGIFYAGYHAYKLRDYAILSEMENFREKYLYQENTVAKLYLLGSLTEIFDSIEEELQDKDAWTQLAVRLLAAEAGAIAVLFILQSFVRVVTS